MYILKNHIDHRTERNLSVLKFKTSSFQLVSGLVCHHRSDPRPVDVGFVGDKVVLGQVFL